jgi:hypothetical protein
LTFVDPGLESRATLRSVQDFSDHQNVMAVEFVSYQIQKQVRLPLFIMRLIQSTDNKNKADDTRKKDDNMIEISHFGIGYLLLTVGCFCSYFYKTYHN